MKENPAVRWACLGEGVPNKPKWLAEAVVLNPISGETHT